MKLSITHQESYSRGELILRTLFGVVYIAIPHFFLLVFVSSLVRDPAVRRLLGGALYRQVSRRACSSSRSSS